MVTQQVQQRYVFGDLLRKWRESRKISQLTLAAKAEVSPRHLSFVETGRSVPSRGMVLRLAEHLEVPLRERNQLLLAAGYAPVYTETALQAPRLSMVLTAIRKVLAGHDPYPALVVDRTWNMVEANASTAMLIEGAPADLMAEPFNVLRFSLHPRGLAPRIVNLTEWRNHILDRLERQVRATADPQLGELYQELLGYPAGNGDVDTEFMAGDVVVPMRLRHDDRELSLFSTVTTFGTPRDITVEELAIESFYPADQETSEYLRSR
ncbi:MAG TPA: helix-turn-helix transcriptional regulator [Pseudonocardiaceae bacterium]